MTAHDTAPFAASTRENIRADVEALNALDDNARARDQLRKETGKRELRVAWHDLAEGVRGLVRANPLASVFTGAALGLWVARRRRAPKV